LDVLQIHLALLEHVPVAGAFATNVELLDHWFARTGTGTGTTCRAGDSTTRTGNGSCSLDRERYFLQLCLKPLDFLLDLISSAARFTHIPPSVVPL
jgi:hypothetical protein